MNVKARMFKKNRQVMLYLDIKGTSDLSVNVKFDYEII